MFKSPIHEVFRATVMRAGGNPERAIMVGDSITDIRTARAANVPVVAVDFGYTDVPIADLRPDRIISSFAELPAAVLHLITIAIGQTKTGTQEALSSGHAFERSDRREIRPSSPP